MRARSPPALRISSTAAGRFSFNLSPLLAGRGIGRPRATVLKEERRGEASATAKLPGEGQGTAINSPAALADRRAPHPNPLPAKSGAREQTSGAATTDAQIE